MRDHNHPDMLCRCEVNYTAINALILYIITATVFFIIERNNKMNNQLDELLNHIEKEYGTKIKKGARHYLEVNLAKKARSLGYNELSGLVETASAIIPLKDPQRGMKVRIDGRTFVNYAEYKSGMAVPGYLAKSSAKSYKAFIPNDSMICNFC